MFCGGQAVAHAVCPPPPLSLSLSLSFSLSFSLSLHVDDGSKGTAGPLQFGTSDVAGVARMRLSTTNCLRDSNSGFSLKPFPKKDNCKATVIIARWPPLALQNGHPFTDLVLTSIWVSSHSPHNPPCEKWWGCRFNRRRLDPDVGSTGLQVTGSKPIRPDLTTCLIYCINTHKNNPNTQTNDDRQKVARGFLRVLRFPPLLHRFNGSANKIQLK